MHGKLRQITIGPLQTTQHLERNNLHMNRGGYLRCIDCVGIELESLFLFLLFREKCCCVGHGCILFFESSLIAKVTKWDLVGRLIQWDRPCCKKGERQFLSFGLSRKMGSVFRMLGYVSFSASTSGFPCNANLVRYDSTFGYEPEFRSS